MAGRRAEANDFWVKGVGSFVVESSTISPMELGRFSPRSTRHTFKFGEGFHPSEFVTLDDLAWMQSHDQEMFCLFQKFTSEDQHRICRVTHLQSRTAALALRDRN